MSWLRLILAKAEPEKYPPYWVMVIGGIKSFTFCVRSSSGLWGTELYHISCIRGSIGNVDHFQANVHCLVVISVRQKYH